MTLQDYGREKTTTTLTSTVLTAANFDAQVTAWAALRAAMQALTLGTVFQHSLAQVVAVSDIPASDPFAQREMKWLINYHDTVTGKKFQSELGTADLGNDHLLAGTDDADLTDSDWTDYITAFQAFTKSPDNPANGVLVDTVYFVGRNT